MSNLPPPPKESYKALLFDYDYLLSKSDQECCYSLSEREVQLILAQTDYIGWRTRYKPTETEIDTDLIDQWMSNLVRKLMSGCCPDDGQLSRFTEDGTFQTSDDGGVTWVDNPDADPRNNAISNPPLPGSAGFNKQCAAADNVRDIFKQYRDSLNAMLDASPTLVSIIAGILAFLAVITGVSGAAIGISVLLMGLAAAMLNLSSGGVTALITDEVLDQFRCLVYCRMDDDGRLTYEAWQGLLVDVASTFDDFPELFFYQTVNGMGFIGVNNAGTTGVSSADDCDCDCDMDCGDQWVPRGTTTYVGTFDGYKRFRSAPDGGTMILGISTNDPAKCCKLIDWRYVGEGSGTVVANYHINCGDPIDGAYIHTGWNLEGCYDWLAAQAATGDTSTYFEAEFLFADCP